MIEFLGCIFLGFAAAVYFVTALITGLVINSLYAIKGALIRWMDR